MKTLTKFLKENKKVITVVLLLLYSPTTDVIKYATGDKFYTVLKSTFKEAIREELVKVSCAYSLKLIEMEIKDIRTPQGVDTRVKFWKANKFNAQIAALKVILNSEYALNELELIAYNEEVYKALLSYGI